MNHLATAKLFTEDILIKINNSISENVEVTIELITQQNPQKG